MSEQSKAMDENEFVDSWLYNACNETLDKVGAEPSDRNIRARIRSLAAQRDEARQEVERLKEDRQKLWSHIREARDLARTCGVDRPCDTVAGVVKELVEHLKAAEESRTFQEEFANAETSRVRTLEAELTSLRSQGKGEGNGKDQTERMVALFRDAMTNTETADALARFISTIDMLSWFAATRNVEEASRAN